MMSICDEIDMKLGTFGADSIFQKARSLSYEERQLVDELSRQALVGKDLDIRAAEKISVSAFAGSREKSLICVADWK
jgi:hypothetical protein